MIFVSYVKQKAILSNTFVTVKKHTEFLYNCTEEYVSGCFSVYGQDEAK